jgi:hypothetical protein
MRGLAAPFAPRRIFLHHRHDFMDLIEQKLVVKDWPLKKPGDELFFGYVVAVGVFPADWSNDGMFIYADFAYSDTYTRYRLPNDDGLLTGLSKYLSSNLEMCGSGNGIYGKVWVRLTEKGYQVDLP